MKSRRMPRRRCVGRTPTHVTPAHGSSPPGIERSNAYAAASPTALSPSYAASARDGGRIFRSRSQPESSSSEPNAPSAASIAARSSSSTGGLISIVMPRLDQSIFCSGA